MPKSIRLGHLALLLLLSALPAWADSPIPPLQAAAKMTVPPGFKVTLFAGEPDLVQPIAFTFDDRGRLWVVENMSYPDWNPSDRDRVSIFEDKDGDGRFDKKTVFWAEGSNLSGIEVGFGGVWLCSTPNLIFVPDRDGDDRPDGPAVKLLDGWDLKAKHNVFNGLAWGPDGWLYGCNGIMSNSFVGHPGAPDSARIPFNCGIWRYHPTRKTFEVVAQGTTNPFGLDWDDRGELFFTNCVIKHAWHAIPGAHFERMYGQDFNPFSYDLMTSLADHIHWAGGPWQESRGGDRHSPAGGGHAHSGAMIYLGDNWPQEYRNNLFTCNIHGNRVNRDTLVRKGSGYVAKHAPDTLFANDPWFRGLALKYGPDGGVFISDWSDTDECHDYIDIHRENGRIFKMTYGELKQAPVDLAKLSDQALVDLHRSKNEWQTRHGRRLLQERALAKSLDPAAETALVALLADSHEITVRLRALWTIHTIGRLGDDRLMTLLDDKEADIRAWSIRLELDDMTIPTGRLAKYEAIAASDPSPVVRLALASSLQRLPLDQRWGIAKGLAAHAEDASDANLPLLNWQGVEPLVKSDPVRALELAKAAKIPLLRQYLARRYVSLIP